MLVGCSDCLRFIQLTSIVQCDCELAVVSTIIVFGAYLGAGRCAVQADLVPAGRAGSAGVVSRPVGPSQKLPRRARGRFCNACIFRVGDLQEAQGRLVGALGDVEVHAFRAGVAHAFDCG